MEIDVLVNPHIAQAIFQLLEACWQVCSGEFGRPPHLTYTSL